MRLQQSRLLDEVLGTGLTTGRLLIAERQGEVLGYLTSETPTPDHVRITSMAVCVRHRRTGIGRLLLDQLLAGTPADTSVSAVVGLDDLPSAGLLLSRGFLAPDSIESSPTEPDVRLCYRFKLRVEYIDPDSRQLIPLAERDHLLRAIAAPDVGITALVRLMGEPAFEVSRFERDDPATLQSDEAAAGLTFSGAVLAAITFLLGFSFASQRFPDDVRVLLIGATFATTMSLIIYASASGELARMRSNAFGRIMKWGNVLSEYGGVLPFLISLPITYAEVTGSEASALTAGALLTVALALYERSRFSIADRFRWTFPTVVLAALTCLSPILGVLLVVRGSASWPWAAALMTALAARSLVYLFRRGPEAGMSARRPTWQVRR
ncbi:GNAT family N-acetyltransferase [Streptomyces finlayi]|uniref:GNAT family N-acetyltransferase n=1 Tax=Streptomyces finlayi TaxID=67296 RepID=UPI001678F9BE|nr:GNAT family N-acetyltransferase [Streptomyces finlayi]